MDEHAAGSTARRKTYHLHRGNGRADHPENASQPTIPDAHTAPGRQPPRWSPELHYELLDSGVYYEMGDLEKNLYVAFLRWANKDTGKCYPRQEDLAAEARFHVSHFQEQCAKLVARRMVFTWKMGKRSQYVVALRHPFTDKEPAALKAAYLSKSDRCHTHRNPHTTPIQIRTKHLSKSARSLNTPVTPNKRRTPVTCTPSDSSEVDGHKNSHRKSNTPKHPSRGFCV